MATHSPLTHSPRYHYLDNLRALAMLVGIIFHAALAYSPLMHNIWFVADTVNHPFVDKVVFWLHLFRMPLFFVVAGFFAFMLIEKRQISGFLKNRAQRILLPFVIFLPLVMASIIAMILWAMDNVTNLPPILQLSKELPRENSNVSSAHLWFLFNLFGFCLVLALLVKLKLFNTWLSKKLVSPFALIVILPLLIMPALYSQQVPFPAPEKLYPELWSYGFYGILFLVGAAIFRHQYAVEQLAQYLWLLAIIGTIAAGLFCYWLPSEFTLSEVREMLIHGPQKLSGFEQLIMVALQSVAAVYFTLLSLVLGKRLLNFQNAMMRYVADASYWLYIVHIPLVIAIQMVLLDIELPMMIKFTLSLLFTFGVGFATYALFVRTTWMGKMLNGRKYSARTKVSTLACAK